jgi:phosphoribosylaminoimidazole-succinocarboxamide synthase
VSVKLQDKQLIYEGSVKRVFKNADGNLLFQYTDDYSVFDWGKMPDTIANKGRSLAIMGAHFFDYLADAKRWLSLPNSLHLKKFDQAFLKERFGHRVFSTLLSKQGVRSHYKGLVDEQNKPITLKAAASQLPFLSVVEASVTRPKPVVLANQNVYYYEPLADAEPVKPRLVPLEVIFRFGMPAGSSLKGRLEKDPTYAKILGLNGIPEENSWFDKPVIEFFTKLEDKDRLLTAQEALIISGLSPERFEELVEVARDLALGLFVLFAERGIELWDGKFEFAVDKNGLLLVDSIGPDELRLIYKGVHLSKEMIRQVYRGSSWEKAIKEAQTIAKQKGRTDWKEICRKDLKEEPKPLPGPAKAMIDQLYGVIVNQLVGEEIFANQPTLDEFADMVKT